MLKYTEQNQDTFINLLSTIMKTLCARFLSTQTLNINLLDTFFFFVFSSYPGINVRKEVILSGLLILNRN